MRGLLIKGLAFLPLTLALSRKGRGDFSDTRLRGNDGADFYCILRGKDAFDKNCNPIKPNWRKQQ